ncbi:MAG: hypothetical protein D6689_03610 [Deltaproteobacteria bacterium]|nr:MAG: hypothetical protein D6689_03610 [Deltaproteobacteria bacterium]
MTAEQAARLVGQLIDEVIERVAGDADDVARARADFDDRRGRVFEDEELWEAWTQAFLEWYAFERVRDGQRWPPAASLLAGEPDPDRRDAVRALIRSHRSLFEVVAIEPGRVRLRDLIGGARFAVDEPRALHGVSAGDVVEARLVGVGGHVVFGRALCYHPPATGRAVAARVAALRAAGRDRRDILDAIAALRVKALRYPNVAPERVYAPGGMAR